MPLGLRDSAVSLKLALLLGLLLAAGMAGAQPANDNFTNAWVITGQSGTTNGDNTFASLESCENNIVNSTEFGPEAITNTVWFAWTATATGTLEVNNAGSANVDFVLSVWTSTNTIPTICDGSLTNILADDGNGGISQLDFSVVAGKTYYISLSSYDDGTSPNDNVGPYVLNWNQSISQFSSGSFQLSSGNYLVSERDSQSPNVAYDGNTVDPSLLGARITITRPAPGYGRVLVDYSVTDPGYTNLIITNITATTITTTYKYQYYYNGQYYNYTPPDLVVTNNMGLPAGITIFTNVVPASTDFTLVTNTVSFDNYQLGQDVLLPLVQRGETISISNQTYHLPGMAVVTLSNPRPDPQEPSILAPPTLSLSLTSAIVNTASTTFPQPSGSLGLAYLNLERSTFRVDKDVYSGNAVINVIRTGGKADQSISVDYIIDPTPGNGLTQYSPANTFPLQAGSDYATKNSDFTPVSGTLTWAAYDTTPKIISIPIINNSKVEQNEDFLVKLYFQPSEQHNNEQVGEVNQANVTILFDDTDGKQQPAGALDRTWNQNGVKYSNPPYLPYPGTAGGGGTVYAVAEQPDGKAIIAGSFTSFDSQLYNRIARVLNNGFQDTSFLASPNSGANDFISSLALQPNGKILIGGNFTSFNGSPRYHIARLNSDGSVDSTFNPGFGANGTVWCMILQTNGQVVIGGSFTSYNGTNVNKVARINADGSLDTTFNPGTGPNDTVNAVAVDSSGRVIIGGSFDSVAGVSNGGISRLNVDGSLDTTFTAGIGTYNPDSDSTDPVYAIAVQSDGKILIGGSFSFLDLINYNGLARLNSDGTIDLNFKPGTGTLNPVTGLADTIYSVLLQTNNEILIGGDLTTFNQTRRIGVARLFGDGTVDTSFMDSTYNQFAGLPNQYFNSQAVSTNYPYYNTRNAVYALAQEAGGNVIIGGIFPWVGGGYTYDDIRPRSNVARLVGGSTPGPGNIEFSYGSYSVNNSQGSLYVSLVRTNGNLGIVSATFTTNTDGTGAGIASGEDFSLNPIYSSPTWTTAWSQNAWMYDVGVTGPNYNTTPVNTTQADVYVGVTNSGNITGNLSANFKLSNPIGNFSLGGEYISLGAALGAQAAAPLTIIDTSIKPGVLGFSSPTYSVVQNRSVATITVTRTNGSDGIVTVWYAVSNGTATNGVDYTVTTPNQLTFAVGQTNATFTIPTKSATTIHPDKIVNLQLFSPAGGATLGLTNAILNLINGVYTYGHLEFSAANYTVNENGGAAVVTINRVGGSTGTLNVTMITADQTAIDGTNYIGISTNLQWNSGDASPRNITIPVLDDGVVTPNLVANLLLTNSFVNTTNNVGPLSFGNTNATLTINNLDSAGSVQFSTSSYSVKKYGGYALIPVIRTGGSIGTVTVGYTTIDGSAQSGSSYTTTAGTLTFSNGVVSQSFLVPITNNPAVTGLVSLTLQLSPPTGLATLGTPNVAVLNIIDGDSVDETPGLPDVTYGSAVNGFNAPVYCLALQTNNRLIVGGDFTLADGVYRQRIARLNDDGTLDSSFLLPSSTIGADNSVRAIAIQSDGRVLVGGKFTNMNSQVVNGIARLNYDGTLDSLFNVGSGADSPIYALAQTFVNGNAAILVGGSFAHLDGQPANCIGRLTGTGSPDPSFNTGSGANGTIYALAVQADGRVIIGGDFTAVNGVSVGHIARLNLDGSVDLTFTNGTANDSVRAIAIQLDGQILAGGLFTSVNGNTSYNHIVRLNSADGSPDSTFNPGLNIISPGPNNSVFSIAVQTDGRIVVGGTFTQANGVTRNRITRLNANGTTDPTINFGVGADSFVAAIAVEESTIASYPPNVPDEKIIIGGGFLNYFGAPHPYLARIYGGSEGGSGAFTFSSAFYGVNENGTNVVITVERTGGTSGTNADGSGSVYVTFAATNGTAQAGVNYTAVTTNLNFPMGEVLETVTIPVMDDNVISNDLTVNLSLNPTAPAQYGDQPTALLTITNVDSAINFQLANYQVNKYASNVLNGFAPIYINRLGATYGTSTVVFNTSTNGTATPGLDYLAQTNVVVTFEPGVSNEQVNIPIINGVSDGNTTVGLQLTNVTGSVLYSPSNAVLTILDQTLANGSFAFSATNYVVSEGGGSGYTNATITVLRTNGASGIVTVGYQTADGSAIGGAKYVPTSGTLTFGDGVLSQSFVVPVINTTTIEPTENFSVILTNPTGGSSLGVSSNASVTILNTNIGVMFASATNTFIETQPFATINVVRYNNTQGTSTVNYSTTNGTALAGTNYTTTSGTLIFNNGAAQAAILIPLIYDTNVTGNLQFTVGLASANPGVQIGTPGVSTIVLQDADAGINFSTNATTVLKNIGSVLITVLCSNTNVEPVSVNYATTNGTATAGTDYTAASGTLTFSNGIATNTFSIPISNNSLVNGSRYFNVVLSNPTSTGHLISPSQQTVTIADSNSGISLSSSTYSVYKTQGAAVITVNRTDNTNIISTVNFVATNGTAVNGLNYYATNGTLVFTNGVTSQTFSIPIIATTKVQPDLTVQLALSNPTNGILLAPTAATLTIRDNTGSFVIPAGSQMITNYTSLSDYTNGIIGSNDMVQVLFALRDAAAGNVNNLVATLLATNGVISPTPASQTYGPLTYHGHSVSMPFTFTARGTNNQQIAPTFNLQDGTTNIGTAIFSFILGSTTTVLSNNAVIIINDDAAASPYPSVINVSGVGGSLIKATVTLNKFAHTDPHDVSALVVAPAGPNTLIMSHAGGHGYGVTNLVLTFDDAATNSLPFVGAITNGTYKPTATNPPAKFP